MFSAYIAARVIDLTAAYEDQSKHDKKARVNSPRRPLVLLVCLEKFLPAGFLAVLWI
jgi:hypothetical protein